MIRSLRALATVVVALTLSCDDSPEESGDETQDMGMVEDTASEPEPVDRASCLELGIPADGTTPSIMDAWGAACETDEDCQTLLQDSAAVCDRMAVVYELPGGYCTKPCELPDTTTTFVLDAPDCSPQGGVACIGQRPAYQRCARVCDSEGQCDRDGYLCRTMPAISLEGDPTVCLMPECCFNSCG